jgi:putative zinc finger protein
MNRHISTEQLSAYLDTELGVVEMRQLEAHCAACPECGARLASMRRVVTGLGRADRVALPPDLHQQIRRQVVQEIPAHGMRKVLQSLRFMLFPLGPGMQTAAAMGLALVVGLFAVSHSVVEPVPAPEGIEEVTVKPGAQFDSQPTTSEVAGRKFILTEAGWVQDGLEWTTPAAHVDANSPRGKELLNRYSDLRYLLVEGSPVVLTYGLQTVEIRVTPPTRVLGFETDSRSQVLEA